MTTSGQTEGVGFPSRHAENANWIRGLGVPVRSDGFTFTSLKKSSTYLAEAFCNCALLIVVALCFALFHFKI